MPKDRIEFLAPHPVDTAMAACRTAVETLGWKVSGRQSPTRLSVRSGAGATSWATKLDVNLAPASTTGTSVRVDGRIGGYGPLQKRHLQNALNELQSAVLAALPAAAPEGAPDPTATIDALERLAELHRRGVLTDEELADQKARVLAGDDVSDRDR